MKSPSERFEKSMTKDNLWIYILSLLKERDWYPYEIRRKVQERFGFMPGNVTAYVVLNKLRLGGYVRIGKSKKFRGPERVYYRITPKGVEELRKAKESYKKTLQLLEKAF